VRRSLTMFCVGFEEGGNKDQIDLSSRLRPFSASSLNVHRVMA
jgi:hypothetical protein